MDIQERKDANAGKEYKMELSIPLMSAREAQICYDVLRVDSEPPRSQVTKSFEVKDKVFSVKLISKDLRQLRVSLTSLMDHLQLVIQTMSEFGPPVSSEYSHYK